MTTHLLSIRDLDTNEILSLLNRGLEIKKDGGLSSRPLSGQTIGLLFEKASTRTRVSFETATFRLGGQTLFLGKADSQLSRGEPIKDTIRVLSRYLNALVVRTYGHELIEEMVKWSDIPVINALTDRYHPCQVLSDLLSIVEKRGNLDDLKVAWIGDGNNMAHSWINAAHVMGFELVLACPAGYYPLEDMMKDTGDNIRITEDPKEAAQGADVINTDVWASMGQEDESKKRLKVFEGFQLNQSLVQLSNPNVLVMHCLPAHRGEEITDEVIEGANSIVFDQAENRLHLQQALLERLLIKQ